jgi:chemotaxis protein methyltransferase CheR
MPRLGYAWPGFRRVHRQICKRLGHRVRELGLSGFDAYQAYVLDHDTEWSALDASCRVTVSRFYRDAAVFNHLAHEILPRLAAEAQANGRRGLRAWSAGCASGEEPYSLMLAWTFAVAPEFPQMSLNVIATDIDEGQLARARTGCYRRSTLRELPEPWRESAFTVSGPLLCLKPQYREGIEFQRQDVRAEAPAGPFDLILCRNLAFTYFDAPQRAHVLALLYRELAPGGRLIIGRTERLPEESLGLSLRAPQLRIYQRPRETALAEAG